MMILPVDIAKDQIGGYFVSTIFIDLSYPYYETMVFDSREDSVWEFRTSFYDEALKAHAAGVDFALAEQNLGGS
jgi:hypothetical protein